MRDDMINLKFTETSSEVSEAIPPIGKGPITANAWQDNRWKVIEIGKEPDITKLAGYLDEESLWIEDSDSQFGELTPIENLLMNMEERSLWMKS